MQEPFHLTDIQLSLIGHSLGINTYHAKLSKLKRDKKLPKEFYRNYFIAGSKHDDYPQLIRLVQMGLMNAAETIDYFHVTDFGILNFRSEFKRLIVNQ